MKTKDFLKKWYRCSSFILKSFLRFLLAKSRVAESPLKPEAGFEWGRLALLEKVKISDVDLENKELSQIDLENKGLNSVDLENKRLR